MKNILALFTISLLISCAQIVTPDGGIKDEIAPKLIKTYPTSGSINTFPKKIILIFNENIELKNKIENISFTPTLNYTPNITSSKNKIEIYLKSDSLKSNVTYTINFGKSIVDINEGNKIENLTYTFSTGNYLDTAMVSGNILKIKNNQKIKKAKITLINKSNGYKYTTFSEDNGSWTIYNLPYGNYQLESYFDANQNNKLDNTELYFVDNQFTINKNQTTVSSKLIPMKLDVNNNNLKITSIKYINPYSLSVKFNQVPVDIKSFNYSINKTLQKKQKELTSTITADSFILYHPFIPQDTLEIAIGKDSIQKFKVIQPKGRKIDSLILETKDKLYRNLDPEIIQSNIPIQSINTEKISMNGSSEGFIIEQINPYELSVISKNLNDKIILFSMGALTDINGNNNNLDTIKTFKAKDEETGNLEFTLKDSTQKYTGTIMIRIFNTQHSYQLKNQLNSIIKFRGLLPGSYSIEAYYDENNNEIWDSGDYYKNIQPEKIILKEEIITIKANWDSVGVDIYME